MKYYACYTITAEGEITYDYEGIPEEKWERERNKYDGEHDLSDDSWWVYVCVDEDDL